MVTRGTLARRRVSRCVLTCLLPVLCCSAASRAAGDTQADNPIGVHSMLYLDHPFSAKQAMFAEAAATGASEIRLDIALAGVFPAADGPPDWSGVDEFMSLARHYRLRVLADLLATPSYMQECPPGTPLDHTYRCPPSDPRAWGRLAGVLARHTRGVIDDFEIINEPDGGWAFFGTPQQYAAILAASAAAIHRANPNARVANGGLMDAGPSGQVWMDAVLASLGVAAKHTIDIANVHLRMRATDVGRAVRAWRAYFTAAGIHGPLWVTETGYPADTAQQRDPGFQDGAAAQARYLATVIPTMLCAGARKVFVTERDGLGGRFDSEGFLDSTDPLTAFPQFTLRPSFYTLRALAHLDWRSELSVRGCRQPHTMADSRARARQ
jgi:hypothetical protein